MMTFDLSVFAGSGTEILGGFLTTLLAWISGTALSLVLGLAVSLGLVFGPHALAIVLRSYVEAIRGTPFLVQLFILYFGGPYIGLTLDPLPAGLLGLAIYGGAYFAEIFRAGLLATPAGQVEAATLLGLTRRQIVGRIQFPQMMVVILPALVNMVIILSKETTILSIITVPELTFVVKGIGTRTFAFVETLLALALGYWLLVEATSACGKALEQRVARHLVR
jgi:polar amino acid transport system permease protein